MRRALAMAVVASAALWAGSAAAQSSWIDGSPIQTRLRVGADGTTYVGVWIDAPRTAVARARAPMAIALVVDTSGSMAGDKIENARLAAASLLESAADGDIVSIVAFSNHPVELAPPTVVSAATRPGLMQRVGQLYAAGGTNLYGGVQAALGRMSQAPATHPIRRVFLISDGHANIGPSDPASLTSLAANGTEWGAQISAIGVGYEYDQATLASMVVRTSGRLYHLGQPQQMAHILEQEMGLLSRTVALNAFLEVQPAPGVRIVEGATLGAEVVEGRVRLPLGALYAGQHRELLFRARVDTARPGAHPLGQARLVYEVPGERERRVAERALRYEVTTDVASAETSQAPAVVAMLADHQASEAQRRAASMMRAGRQQDAAAELSRARAALAAAAQRAPSDSASAARMRERAGRMEAASTRATSAPPAMAPATAYDFEAEAIQAEGY